MTHRLETICDTIREPSTLILQIVAPGPVTSSRSTLNFTHLSPIVNPLRHSITSKRPTFHIPNPSSSSFCVLLCRSCKFDLIWSPHTTFTEFPLPQIQLCSVIFWLHHLLQGPIFVIVHWEVTTELQRPLVSFPSHTDIVPRIRPTLTLWCVEEVHMVSPYVVDFSFQVNDKDKACTFCLVFSNKTGSSVSIYSKFE